MSAINRSLEQSRLEIMILAIGVLVLVSLLGLFVFINLRFRPHYERKARQDDYGYEEKPVVSFADNAKRELATLTRRVTASASVDAAASGQDTKSLPGSRRFQLVPSTNRETTTQEPVQDDHEDMKPASSGHGASHDETGLQIVMI
ncbi:hypothetical protein LMH87_003635 [Akanthomyces muscarius]|uniref:Uncharacterized protein n=1 Tax=Akanthomyces muscarius TaxID=2231603 RepID=A0A9W8UH45_AKAMU|nr:hypothetical protein LMH87_003635 [Akanthomyces muscarius]KAJ4144765.1 hypothetical protein LMH87_003635 [Akanthomyces muscarius]